jgi:hypothetical protein
VEALSAPIARFALNLDPRLHPFSTMSRWGIGSPDQQQDLRTAARTPVRGPLHRVIHHFWITVWNVRASGLERPQ